jgi:hypothetical protein
MVTLVQWATFLNFITVNPSVAKIQSYLTNVLHQIQNKVFCESWTSRDGNNTGFSNRNSLQTSSNFKYGWNQGKESHKWRLLFIEYFLSLTFKINKLGINRKFFKKHTTFLWVVIIKNVLNVNYSTIHSGHLCDRIRSNLIWVIFRML